MALINVHIFTYAEMLNAIKSLNEFHGLPVEGGVSMFSEDSFTQLSEDQYYIHHSDEWTSVLGTPTNVDIPNE